MRITILGTGALAAALGGRWGAAGHTIAVAGRSPEKAAALAASLGGEVRAVGEAGREADAVLLAVSWTGVEDILRVAGDSLTDTTLIDPTNAVAHGIGVLTTPPDTSGAHRVAALAPGAYVVKAFHLFPADRWTDPANPAVAVAICGDHPPALRVTETLVRAAGSDPVVLGGLARARQLEEVAGFAIALAFAGVDPRTALPPAAKPA
ncbi:NADPH-dependent F420 reductase [Nocardia takedensis]